MSEGSEPLRPSPHTATRCSRAPPSPSTRSAVEPAAPAFQGLNRRWHCRFDSLADSSRPCTLVFSSFLLILNFVLLIGRTRTSASRRTRRRPRASSEPSLSTRAALATSFPPGAAAPPRPWWKSTHRKSTDRRCEMDTKQRAACFPYCASSLHAALTRSRWRTREFAWRDTTPSHRYRDRYLQLPGSDIFL